MILGEFCNGEIFIQGVNLPRQQPQSCATPKFSCILFGKHDLNEMPTPSTADTPGLVGSKISLGF